MVGEIRDQETAEIAIQASLTGHLVLSTVHTNDAAGAVTRLVDMGVEPFLVASSLIGVLAQRLVRRVCPDCREPYTPTDEELKELGLSRATLQGALRRGRRSTRPRAAPPATATATAAAPASTSCCSSTTTSASWCSRTWTRPPSRRRRSSKGMRTLLDDGARKVALGETTIAEVLSITQEDI